MYINNTKTLITEINKKLKLVLRKLSYIIPTT